VEACYVDALYFLCRRSL